MKWTTLGHGHTTSHGSRPVITYGSIESIASQLSAVAMRHAGAGGTAVNAVINKKSSSKKTAWKRLLCSCGRLACVKLPEPRAGRKAALLGPQSAKDPLPPTKQTTPPTSHHPRAQ